MGNLQNDHYLIDPRILFVAPEENVSAKPIQPRYLLQDSANDDNDNAEVTDGGTMHCRCVVPINSARPALNYALHHGELWEIELKLHTVLALAVVRCFSNFLVPRTFCKLLIKCTRRHSICDLRLWTPKT